MAGEARTTGIWIGRPVEKVYGYLAEPRNFPDWASGLCTSIARDARCSGEEWLAETPYGPMRVRFTASNPHGVLDHHVIPEAGPAIRVPMRAVAHAGGTLVTLTLLRQPDMTDAKFDEDARWVERDLATLKRVLEEHFPPIVPPTMVATKE